MNQNQVKGVLLGTSHYTKNATEFTPKGTLMMHYALTEFASKELEKEYEDSKGANFSTVKEGTFKDKPIHFTSQIFEGVSEGSEVIFDWVNERLTRNESLEQRIVKSADKKAKDALSKVLTPETVAKLELAKKLGLVVSI